MSTRRQDSFSQLNDPGGRFCDSCHRDKAELKAILAAPLEGGSPPATGAFWYALRNKVRATLRFGVGRVVIYSLDDASAMRKAIGRSCPKGATMP